VNLIICIIDDNKGGLGMQRRKYAVVGGDMRNIYLAELLKKDYQYVEIYGFEKSGKPWAIKNSPLEIILGEAQVVAGGIPLTTDDGYLWAPLSETRTPIGDIIEKVPQNSLFVAGKIKQDIRDRLVQKGVKCVDILDREEMAILNAVPTAEGAISILIGEMPTTLMDSRILIIGYGRIGKILSKMLHGLGSEVWVAARNYSDLAWIEAQDLKPVPLSQLARYVSDMDAIVNTVPALVLTKEILKKARNGCFLLDLASSPGGIDFKAAAELGFRVKWALGLPGKMAPLTAGNIIRRTIYNILEEEEA